MNKNLGQDIELKLRQLSNRGPLYKTLSSEERILIPGLRSVAQEGINEIIRKDLKTHLPILQLHRSRDVSHLKDLSGPKTLAPVSSLPSDLNSLRLLAESSSLKNLKSQQHICKKKECIERLAAPNHHDRSLEPFSYSEQAIPTGRKEAQNLLMWFNTMQGKYEQYEEFEVVLALCGQEILKQVKGQCKDLGVLLQKILEFYQDFTTKAKKRLEEQTESSRLSHEASLNKLQGAMTREIEKLQDKALELQNLNEKSNNSLKNCQEEVEFYKKKLHEMQRVYLAEQDVWRKRIMDIIKDNSKKEVRISNESYKLAIAKWRKDLFYSEVENQPDVELPIEIRDKLENELPLNDEELAIYREIYYKADEVKNNALRIDEEVQTEFIVDESRLEAIVEELQETTQQENFRILDAEKSKAEGIREKNFEEANKEKEENNENKEENKEDKETQTDFDLASANEMLLNIEKFMSLNDRAEIEDYLEDLEGEIIEANEESEFESSQEDSRRLSMDSSDNAFSENQTHSNPKSPKVDNRIIQEITSIEDLKALESKLIEHQQSVINFDGSRKISLASSEIREEIEQDELGDKNINSASKPIKTSAAKKSMKRGSKVEEDPEKLNKPFSQSKRNSDPKNSKKPITRKPSKNSKKGPATPQASSPVSKLLKSEMKSDPDSKPSPSPFTMLSEASAKSVEDSQNLLITPQPTPEPSKKTYTYSVVNDEKKLLSKFTSNFAIKRDSILDLKQPQEKRRSSALIPNLSQPIGTKENLAQRMQKTAELLINNLKEKKNALEALEKEIQDRRKILQEFDKEELKSPSIQNRRKSAQLIRPDSGGESLAPSPPIMQKRRSSLAIDKLAANLIKRKDTIEIIDEEDESIPDVQPEAEEKHKESWKSGFSAGFTQGKAKGYILGRAFGKEEYLSEGYSRAVNEMNEVEYLGDEERSQTVEPTSVNKLKKNKLIEIKSSKELTKFFEFNFAKQRVTTRRSTVVTEAITALLKKLPHFLKKKSKISRKMAYKLIVSCYDSSYSQILSEGVNELILVCYEEISQKYGLKNVSDRKFMEFIAAVLKNKDFRRCLMFIRLLGLGSWVSVENYSKFTYLLYIESLKFIKNSKIGIVTDSDEIEDKVLYPTNRLSECVREKLEGKVEKSVISSILTAIEHKSMPDPNRINPAVIELEFVLELICDSYEVHQQKIKSNINSVFTALGSSQDLVPCYVFHMAMRTIAANKYTRIEDHNINFDLTFEDINELCILHNIFTEAELIQAAKMKVNVKEDIFVMKRIAEEVGDKENEGFSVEEWIGRIEASAKMQDEGQEVGIVLWRIYENELRRIQSNTN